jgi:hypothetical protein
MEYDRIPAIETLLASSTTPMWRGCLPAVCQGPIHCREGIDLHPTWDDARQAAWFWWPLKWCHIGASGRKGGRISAVESALLESSSLVNDRYISLIRFKNNMLYVSCCKISLRGIKVAYLYRNCRFLSSIRIGCLPARREGRDRDGTVEGAMGTRTMLGEEEVDVAGLTNRRREPHDTC